MVNYMNRFLKISTSKMDFQTRLDAYAHRKLEISAGVLRDSEHSESYLASLLGMYKSLLMHLVIKRAVMTSKSPANVSISTYNFT